MSRQRKQTVIVLDLLADGRWHATRELIDAGVLRAAARVHELRAAGYAIETRPRGRGLYEYRLAGADRPIESPAVQAPLGASCFECGSGDVAGVASGQWWCERHLAEELGR